MAAVCSAVVLRGPNGDDQAVPRGSYMYLMSLSAGSAVSLPGHPRPRNFARALFTLPPRLVSLAWPGLRRPPGPRRPSSVHGRN